MPTTSASLSRLQCREPCTARGPRFVRWHPSVGSSSDSSSCGISGIEPRRGRGAPAFTGSVCRGCHGSMEMDGAPRRASARVPDELIPGTLRVISVAPRLRPGRPMRGLPAKYRRSASSAYIARYALGRDYHKLMRNRLRRLAEPHCGSIARADRASRVRRQCAGAREGAWRAMPDSAGSARTQLLINRNAGSWFFLGEILTDLPLPIDVTRQRSLRHVHALHRRLPDPGDRRALSTRCTTAASLISPSNCADRSRSSFAKLMGNRIYRMRRLPARVPMEQVAQLRVEADFIVRHNSTAPSLTDLFAWSEEEFLARTEGTAIRRIGHECWLAQHRSRTGECAAIRTAAAALRSRLDHPSALDTRARAWALDEHALPV